MAPSPRLTEELALYIKAACSAHAEVTDEQSKPENQYAPRGLEASDLARGQARQVTESEQIVPSNDDFAPA